MRGCRLVWLGLLVLCTTEVRSQQEPLTRPSHRPIGEEQTPEGFEAALARRLELASNSQQSQAIAEKLMKLLAENPELLENPKLLEMAQQVRRNPTKFQQDLIRDFQDKPGLRKQFEKAFRDKGLDGARGRRLLEQLQREKPDGANPGAGPNPRIPPDVPMPKNPEDVPPDPKNPAPDPNQPPGENPRAEPPPTPKKKPKTWLEKNVEKHLGKYMEQFAEELVESSTFETIAKSLLETGFDFQADLPVGDFSNPTMKKFADSLPNFEGMLPSTDALAESMPQMDIGDAMPSLPSFGEADLSVSAPSASMASNAGDMLVFLVWIVVVVMVAVIAWKLRELFVDDALEVEPKWKPGPWPVRPNAVASHADLIAAFEYIACLVLGREALHWNHHELADRLGENVPHQREAADRLAQLYEQARYSPSLAPLPNEDLALARQDLSALARGAG